jgi:RNA recognition motif-containing protein
MSNVSEAEKAMEALNLTSVGGRNINVNEARPQKDRPRRGFGQY